MDSTDDMTFRVSVDDILLWGVVNMDPDSPWRVEALGVRVVVLMAQVASLESRLAALEAKDRARAISEHFGEDWSKFFGDGRMR